MTVDPICHNGNYADYSDQQLHEELAYWRCIIDEYAGKDDPLIRSAHDLAQTIANVIQLRIAREESERHEATGAMLYAQKYGKD